MRKKKDVKEKIRAKKDGLKGFFIHYYGLLDQYRIYRPGSYYCRPKKNTKIWKILGNSSSESDTYTTPPYNFYPFVAMRDIFPLLA